MHLLPNPGPQLDVAGPNLKHLKVFRHRPPVFDLAVWRNPPASCDLVRSRPNRRPPPCDAWGGSSGSHMGEKCTTGAALRICWLPHSPPLRCRGARLHWTWRTAGKSLTQSRCCGRTRAWRQRSQRQARRKLDTRHTTSSTLASVCFISPLLPLRLACRCYGFLCCEPLCLGVVSCWSVHG